VKLGMRRLDILSAHSWEKELAQNSNTQRLALIGGGVVGDPVLIPWLIEYMNTPEQARIAGEAFTMITGADIAFLDLEGESRKALNRDRLKARKTKTSRWTLMKTSPGRILN